MTRRAARRGSAVSSGGRHLEHRLQYDLARLAKSRGVDRGRRVADGVERADLRPGDHHRGYASAQEGEVIAAADARRVIELVTEPFGRGLDALMKLEALVRRREAAAAYIHVQIDVRHDVLRAVGRCDGVREERIRADESLLLAREGHEDHRIL